MLNKKTLFLTCTDHMQNKLMYCLMFPSSTQRYYRLFFHSGAVIPVTVILIIATWGSRLEEVPDPERFQSGFFAEPFLLFISLTLILIIMMTRSRPQRLAEAKYLYSLQIKKEYVIKQLITSSLVFVFLISLVSPGFISGQSFWYVIAILVLAVYLFSRMNHRMIFSWIDRNHLYRSEKPGEFVRNRGTIA